MISKKFLLRLIRHIYAKTSPTYHRTIRLLQSTEYLSEESYQQLQFRHLKNMLVHAFEKSHYYRETFRQAGVDPHDMIELDDIQAFPLLTKQEYRDNLDKIMSKDAKKPFLIRLYTGGTTGTPLPLYRHLNDFVVAERLRHGADSSSHFKKCSFNSNRRGGPLLRQAGATAELRGREYTNAACVEP